MNDYARWFAFGLMVFGCGGPPAPSAPEQSSSTEEVAATPDEATGGEQQPAASGPVTDEDLNAILQLVINDEELDKVLNLTEPGRFPLKVAGESLPAKLEIVKSTEPVKVVPGPESEKDAVLVFTEIDVTSSRASVRYRYDVEGIRGTASLSKGPHGWELVSSRIVER